MQFIHWGQKFAKYTYLQGTLIQGSWCAASWYGHLTLCNSVLAICGESVVKLLLVHRRAQLRAVGP